MLRMTFAHLCTNTLKRLLKYLQWREHDCQAPVAAAGDHVSGMSDYNQLFFPDQVYAPLPVHMSNDTRRYKYFTC